MVSADRDRQGDGVDQQVFHDAQHLDIIEPDLQSHDDRQVPDVDPVGSISDRAARRAFIGTQGEAQADEGKAEAPAGQRIGSGIGPALQAVISRHEAGSEADHLQAGDCQGDGNRHIGPPELAECVEQPALTVQDPAKGETGAIGGQCDHVRVKTDIRRRDAKPAVPHLGIHEGQACRDRQQERQERRVTDKLDERATRSTHFPGRINDRDKQTDDDCANIENAQQVEEPEMGQGKVFCRQRRIFRRFRGFAPIGLDRAPDNDRDDQHQDREPERGEGSKHAFEAIKGKSDRTTFLPGEAREKAGEDKEEQHAEDVGHIESQAKGGAAVGVMGDPHGEVTRDE